MYTSIQLINLLKTQENLDTDYAVAKRLGLCWSTVARVSKNQGSFGIDTSLLLAELLHLEPLPVIASIQYEQALRQNNKAKQFLYFKYTHHAF